MSVLNDKVLLLNRLMQPLRLISVKKTFFLMSKPRRKDPATKVATALEIDEKHRIVRPVTWEEWITLPVRAHDRSIATVKHKIRVPTIIVLAEFDRIIVVNRRMNKSSLWDRQKGKDMYTLEPLTWANCDIDHFVCRAKGGKTTWTNCGLTTIANNRRKGDKTAKEAGLRLRLPLVEPPPKPLSIHLKRDPRFPEWDIYIKD